MTNQDWINTLLMGIAAGMVMFITFMAIGRGL